MGWWSLGCAVPNSNKTLETTIEIAFWKREELNWNMKNKNNLLHNSPKTKWWY